MNGNFEDTVARAVRIAMASIKTSQENHEDNMVSQAIITSAVREAMGLSISPQASSTPKTHRRTRTVPSPMKRHGKMSPSRREYTLHIRNTLDRYHLESRRNPDFMVAVNEVISTLNYTKNPYTIMRVYLDLGEAMDNRKRYRKRLSKRMGDIMAGSSMEDDIPEDQEDVQNDTMAGSSMEDDIPEDQIVQEDVQNDIMAGNSMEDGIPEDQITQQEVQEPAAVEDGTNLSAAEDHAELEGAPRPHEGVAGGTERKKQFKLGQLLAVVYDELWYPAQVVDTCRDTDGDYWYQVTFMKRKGSNKFIWPTKEDILWVEESQIVQKLTKLLPVGRRGRFLKLPDDEFEHCDKLNLEPFF